MSQIGQSFGFTPVQGQYNPQLDQNQQLLTARANNPMGIATAQYKQNANQGLGNVLAGISETKGLRPSAAATMGDIAGSRIQGQVAENAGVLGLQEQQANQNMLNNFLMGRNAQDIQNQNQQADRFTNFLQGAGSAAAML